ncbi:hypothetical protein WJX72_010735 [[Myrmecia] bisecta]|uniref:Uncharacterized protein n=1 Tax=[Myrmecia] bisecta TaxID=41462 RepID=A0AAW1QGT5_9CHLO
MYRLEEATSPWGSFFTNMLLLGGQYLQLFVFALLWQTRMTFHLPLQVLCLTLLICSYPSKLAQVHKLPGTFKQLQCLQQAVVGAAHLLQLPPSIVAHLQALTEPSGFLMRYWIFMMVVFGLAVSTWILWVVEVRRRQVFLKRLDLHPDTPIECYLAQMLPLLGLLSLQAISSWWQVDGIQAVHTGL